MRVCFSLFAKKIHILKMKWGGREESKWGEVQNCTFCAHFGYVRVGVSDKGANFMCRKLHILRVYASIEGRMRKRITAT